MDKTIHIELNVFRINNAIRSLEAYQRRIERRTEELVRTLVDGGTEMARNAYGSSLGVEGNTNGLTGEITVSGRNAVIMEFGAGLATDEGHPLADRVSVPVKKWEYSRWNMENNGGAGEGFLTQDHWHFGGAEFHEVKPRYGMLDARDYVVNNAQSEARRVFEK